MLLTTSQIAKIKMILQLHVARYFFISPPFSGKKSNQQFQKRDRVWHTVENVQNKYVLHHSVLPSQKNKGFFLLNMYTLPIIAYVGLNYLTVPWQRSFLFLWHSHIFICVIHRNRKRLHFNSWFSNKLSHYLIFFCTVTDIFVKLLESITKYEWYWFALMQMATKSKGPPILFKFSTFTIGKNVSLPLKRVSSKQHRHTSYMFI